jgi:hypothetical protein
MEHATPATCPPDQQRAAVAFGWHDRFPDLKPGPPIARGGGGGRKQTSLTVRVVGRLGGDVRLVRLVLGLATG